MHKYRMGIVGNCSYIAYIDDHAAVKWLCMPRFDSTFVFGSLLDTRRGGEFCITPAADATSTQHYLENTNILSTEFKASDGCFRVTDFAPRFYQYDRYFRPLMLVRKIEPLQGHPRIRVACLPVGEYGNTVPEVTFGSNHIRYLNLDSHVRLTTDIPLLYIMEGRAFVLDVPMYLVFSYGPPLEAPLAATAEDFLDKTHKYWLQWIKATSIAPIFQEAIIRSALALKLHQFEDTGAIIASGTTSLPESPRSGRTWDYRYCWLRDAYYTLTAFNNVGHFEELEKYFDYVQNLTFDQRLAVQPLYTITGDSVPREKELSLSGYQDNQPVRIGNDAAVQRQNDVYGQILISLLPFYVDRRLHHKDARSTLRLIRGLLDQIDRVFDEPDAGIWEFRNLLQHHCYTYLCHWAGSRAALKIAEALADPPLKERAAAMAKRSEEKIEACYDPRREVYTQAIGVDHLDASALQLISLNYLDPKSPRAGKHLAALEQELKAGDALFFRYIHADDFGKPTSAFLGTAFWYAEALACVGRVDEAVAAVESLLPYANHLGLFSEDADLQGGQWGNFPQTYSHVGLMNAVYRIEKRLDKPIFL